MALTASYIAPCTIARCRTDTGGVWPAVAPKAVAACPFQSVTTSARAGATSTRNAETATKTPTRQLRSRCTSGSFPRAVPLRWPPPHAQVGYDGYATICPCTAPVKIARHPTVHCVHGEDQPSRWPRHPALPASHATRQCVSGGRVDQRAAAFAAAFACGCRVCRGSSGGFRPFGDGPALCCV